jgi:hypothetical protein
MAFFIPKTPPIRSFPTSRKSLAGWLSPTSQGRVSGLRVDADALGWKQLTKRRPIPNYYEATLILNLL